MRPYKYFFTYREEVYGVRDSDLDKDKVRVQNLDQPDSPPKTIKGSWLKDKISNGEVDISMDITSLES